MAKIIGDPTVTPMAVPDWSQTDETKADFIKNKPTKLSQFENDKEYATKEEIGDIEAALDSIIAIQNSLIGGDGE